VPKQIIILEKMEDAGAARLRYRVAFWCAVPVPFQPFYAKPNFVSAWKTISGLGGPIQAEVDALRAGSVVEIVQPYDVDGNLTLAQVKADLQAVFTALQAQVTARDPWDRYATFFDGTTWTNGGV